MLWLDHVQYRNYTGNWQDGQMEGFGEMRYTRDHNNLHLINDYVVIETTVFLLDGGIMVNDMDMVQ